MGGPVTGNIASGVIPRAESPGTAGRSAATATPQSGQARALDRSAPGPLVSIRLESKVSRAFVLLFALVCAAWMAKGIVSPAIADSLAKIGNGAADLERAAAWDGGNPDLRLRLGAAYLAPGEGEDLARARLHIEAALRQRPSHGLTWLQFALLAERYGDMEVARQALGTAVRLDRHNVDVRWEAALLASRWGERALALEHLRYVLLLDPSRQEAAFRMARALSSPGESVASLFPQDPAPLAALLQTAVRQRDLHQAHAVWERRATLTPAIPDDVQREYLELLLQKGEGLAARRIWLALVPRAAPTSESNGVWNGSFEAPALLGWGFDWRIRRVWGVDVKLDRVVAAKGRQSLRISFDSFPTLDFAGVFQVVAVEPGRQYQLRALAKAVNFRTRSGLKLQITTPEGDRILGETPAIAGTTADWIQLETSVQVPLGVSLVHVRLRREKAGPPEGTLGGKVWVDEVSLTPVEGAGT